MTNNLQLLREKSPLIHCITNYVAMNIAANTLLASGASPAMIHTPEETADFVKVWCFNSEHWNNFTIMVRWDEKSCDVCKRIRDTMGF